MHRDKWTGASALHQHNHTEVPTKQQKKMNKAKQTEITNVQSRQQLE